MSRFLSYIHNLRGAAIFFVVGVHARGSINDWQGHVETHNIIRTFFDSREGNGTVMFIFIAGFLFHHLSAHKFVFKKYIEQKFKYVLLPYLIISVPIILFRIYTNFESNSLPEGFNEQSVVYRFFYYVITGTHLAPFWFISAIVLFYFSAPLFYALDRPKIYKYLFPVLIITCLFTYRPAHNANPFLAYLHYLPIYLMGMWASFYKEKILSASTWLIYPLVIIYLTIGALEITGGIPIADEVTFEQVLQDGVFAFNTFMFKAILLCVIVMMLLYHLRFKKMPFLEILGEYSFGIFFVHFIYIFVTRKLLVIIFNDLQFSLLTFTIYFTFILLISIATVHLIKRVAGRYSRHLIGS